MVQFLLRRLLTAFTTLIVASMVVFTVLEVLPGDPALVILGMQAEPETLKATRIDLGLDRPPVQRYFTWLADMATFDLGKSYSYKTPVAPLILQRLQVTLPLALLAVLFAICVGLPLGVLAAWRHRKLGDYGVMMFSQLGIAIPNFWFGLLLVLVLSLGAGLFPAGGFPGWGDDFWGSVQSLVLPVIALGLPEAAILSRITRSAMLDTLREDYIRTARAKGASQGAILRGHALRNALIPIVTIIGLFFGFQIAGAIIVESVFYLPGLGQLIYQSITNRDLIVIKNVVILLTVLVLAINFIVDIVYAVLDPRPKIAA